MHNLNTFKINGCLKPEWNPTMIQDLTGRSDMTIQKIEYDFYSKYPVYIIDNFFDRRTCADLIKQFDAQEQYVVGVDGYGDPEANIGSYRAMGWNC
jgi:hypothetical protein